jgi:hypothetical protein
MKKKALILIVVMMSLLMTPVFSDTSITLPDYEPYGVNEFPEWSMKLRRGESLFFGSLALTMPISVIGYNLADGNLFVGPTDSTDQILYQLSIAATLSLGITLADYILGEIQ